MFIQRVGIALVIAIVSTISNAREVRAASSLCSKWSSPVHVGSLDPRAVPESSGIAVSRQFNDRLYHINDSGSGPAFFTSDLKGAKLRQTAIEGFTPIDTEDLAMGPCGGGKSCLFVADIGDNLKKRDSVRIVVIEEQESFGSTVKPLRTLVLKYPDGPHNAEGFAVTPDGDFLIVTKEQNSKSDQAAPPARVFRLSAGALTEQTSRELEAVGELKLNLLFKSPAGQAGHLVTGIDLSPDGSRVLILTYVKAIEVAVDLTGPFKPVNEWIEGKDYRLISTALLPQQEAVAYLPGGRDFIYSTEHHKGFGDPKLYSSRCEE